MKLCELGSVAFQLFLILSYVWTVSFYILLFSPKVAERNKTDAAQFAPFWNEIIKNLREEDYVDDL